MDLRGLLLKQTKRYECVCVCVFGTKVDKSSPVLTDVLDESRNQESHVLTHTPAHVYTCSTHSYIYIYEEK